MHCKMPEYGVALDEFHINLSERMNHEYSSGSDPRARHAQKHLTNALKYCRPSRTSRIRMPWVPEKFWVKKWSHSKMGRFVSGTRVKKGVKEEA